VLSSRSKPVGIENLRQAGLVLGERFVGQPGEKILGTGKRFIPPPVGFDFAEQQGGERILVTLGKLLCLCEGLSEELCHAGFSFPSRRQLSIPGQPGNKLSRHLLRMQPEGTHTQSRAAAGSDKEIEMVQRDEALNQMFVAFGQGTGPFRVSQAVCRDVRWRYNLRLSDALLADWEHNAVQVLERLRAVGRAAAAEAALAGRITISTVDVRIAAPRVEVESDTPGCADPNPGFPAHEPAAYTVQGILDQILVAFGQGTGIMRVARSAAAALRDRYEPYVDERALALWGEEGVQVLERIRAIGRLAALRTVEGASTVITRPVVAAAAENVESVSKTLFCPPVPPPVQDADGALEAVVARVR